MTPRDWGLASAVLALLADQVSKLLLLYAFGLASLQPGARIFTSAFVDLVMAWNPGVSFSFFSAHSTAGILALIVVALLGVAGLGSWLWRATRLPLAIGLGLVIGGALGNLVDRLIYGRVADFFDLHAFGRNFFACNLADIAISAGVLLLIVDSLRDNGATAGQEARETE
jgi:signal peptidase II